MGENSNTKVKVIARGGSGMGYPIPRKKIPIPGYGNPGDFELKSWDPHPGIFENIPDFRKYPGIFWDPRKSQKIPNFQKNFFFTLKINKNKNRDYPFSKPNFYTKIFFINF